MEQDSLSDFTVGSIPKKILAFMLPVLGALILQAAYGAVDLLVVGQFGTTAGLSGVSTGSQILNLITLVVTGSSMAVTVLISRYLGENRADRINRLLGAAFTLYGLVAIILFILMFFGALPITYLMQAPKEAVDLTAQYIRICGSGIFFIVAYNLLSAIFRGLGDSRSPLIFVGIACIINIIGSVVFAIGLLKRRVAGIEVKRKDFGFNEETVHILKIGIPLALQDLLTQISFVIVCAFVNSLGLTASSGYGIACKIINFAMLLPSALMQSNAAFVSMNVGAKKEDRASQGTKISIAIGLVFGCLVFLCVWFFGDKMCALFTKEAIVTKAAFEYLRGFSFETVVTAILFSLLGYFNGHERTLWTMTQGILQTFLVRIPFAYFMTIQQAGLFMIGLASPLATTFGVLLNLVYLFRFRKQISLTK